MSPRPSIHLFCAVSPQKFSPMPLPRLSLSWILSKKLNIFSCAASPPQCSSLPLSYPHWYLASVEISIYLNLYPRVWHSQLSLFYYHFDYQVHQKNNLFTTITIFRNPFFVGNIWALWRNESLLSGEKMVCKSVLLYGSWNISIVVESPYMTNSSIWTTHGSCLCPYIWSCKLCDI